MSFPMPPELLEQLGLEPCADTDPQWPGDHDALGWGRRIATIGEREELDDGDQQRVEEVPHGRRRRSAV